MENQEQTEQVKYDALAQQTIEYKKGDKTVGVIIGGLPDAAVKEYISNLKETQSRKGENIIFDDDDETAAENLFRTIAIGTINIKLRDGRELSEKENWHDDFLDRYYGDAQAVVYRALSMTFADSKKDASVETEAKDDTFFFDDAETTVYPCKVPFGNGWIDASFELRAPNAAQSKRFKEVMKNNRYRQTEEGLSQILSTPTEELLKLYKETAVSVSGFIRPAINQQIMVVRRHFQTDAEIVEKN